MPYLKSVTLEQSVLPQWAIDNLIMGRSVHQFVAMDVDASIQAKIEKMCRFLEKMAHKYIDKQLSLAMQEKTPVRLRSLKGGPEEVRSLYSCAYNQLCTVEGFPRQFKDMSIHGNPIVDRVLKSI